jgi:hypothetical protein
LDIQQTGNEATKQLGGVMANVNGNTRRLEGAFVVKEGPKGEASIVLESGPGLLVSYELLAGTTILEAHNLIRLMNRKIGAVSVETLESFVCTEVPTDTNNNGTNN